MMDRPLRFCMITTFYPPYNFGGDGIYVQRLSNELARRGHQVDVIHCIDSYHLLAEREPAGVYDNHFNVTVHGLKSRFGFLSPLTTQQTGFPLFKTSKIRQILDKGFDVIHYHNISLVGGPKILEYGQGIKLYTLHEFWLVCPTHVLFKFNRAPCVQPECILCQLVHKRPPQGWRHSGLLETAVKHVDVFITLSHFSKRIHRERGFGGPMVHLPNFVPALSDGMAVPKPDGVDQQAPYFLFVGRLEKVKGLQTIIPIFQRYQGARLLIAGAGTYESELRRLAGGCPNVAFLGYLSGQRLQVLYRGAVAVIVPSITFEMFPLVILEAFRQKTPVIVRNLGGMPEIVEESGGGLIYDTQEELAAALDALLVDSARRDELGRRGHAAYQRKWTPEVHLEQYFSLIHEVGAVHGEALSS